MVMAHRGVYTGSVHRCPFDRAMRQCAAAAREMMQAVPSVLALADFLRLLFVRWSARIDVRREARLRHGETSEKHCN